MKPEPISDEQLAVLRKAIAEHPAKIVASMDDIEGLVSRLEAAEAKLLKYEAVVEAEGNIVQQARNTLHAHNRPDTPLKNADRIRVRDLLDGTAQRLRAALKDTDDEI